MQKSGFLGLGVETGMDYKGVWGKFWGDEIDYGVGLLKVYTYLKTYPVHFKSV